MTSLLSKYFVLASALALSACDGREVEPLFPPVSEENIAAQAEKIRGAHEALRVRVETSLDGAAALIEQSAAEAGEAVEQIITP